MVVPGAPVASLTPKLSAVGAAKAIDPVVSIVNNINIINPNTLFLFCIFLTIFLYVSILPNHFNSIPFIFIYLLSYPLSNYLITNN